MTGAARPPVRSRVYHILAQWILVGVVIAAPWCIGGVQPAVQSWLQLGVALALAVWLVGWVWSWSSGEPAGNSVPGAVVPMLGLILLGVLQLVPVSEEVLAAVSPTALELRKTLAAEDSRDDTAIATALELPAVAAKQPVSLYPASTRRDLSLLVMGVAVFTASSLLFRSSASGIGLCAALALNGLVITIFGIVQKLTWNGMLYWRIPLTHGGSPFGPFVNRNNGGGFLNMCLAASVGLTIWAMMRESSIRESSPKPSRYGTYSRTGGYGAQAVKSAQRYFDPLVIALVIASGILVAGVLSSLSRGAIAAMLAAATCVTFLVFSTRAKKRHLFVALVAGLLGIGLVAWVGLVQSVGTQVTTLLDAETLFQYSLMDHWKDTIRAIPDFLFMGSGLGTYRFLYPLYQQHAQDVWFFHAENHFLEALLETGVPGFLLMLAALGLVARAAWLMLRNRRHSVLPPLAIAGGFAICCQIVHGCMDFGLYIPANMMQFALICGALCGIASASRRARSVSRQSPEPAPDGRRWPVSPVLAVCLVAACVWGSVEMRQVGAVTLATPEAPISDPDNLSAALLPGRINRLQAATASRSDDAEGLAGLATLWVDAYRVQALKQLLTEPEYANDRKAAWAATAPIVIHQRLHELVRTGQAAAWEQLRGNALVRQNLRPALACLVLARRACPLLADAHLNIAMLSGLIGFPEADLVSINRALRTQPANPGNCFRCGLLHFSAQRYADAYATWRHGLALSRTYLSATLELLGSRLQDADTVRSLFPDSPELLVALARGKYRGPEGMGVRRLLLERALQLVEVADSNLPEYQRHYLLGSIHSMDGRTTQATDEYVKALDLHPSAHPWRYDLAVLYKQLGQLDEAREQARLCVRMCPNQTEYRKLLEQIHADLFGSTRRTP